MMVDDDKTQVGVITLQGRDLAASRTIDLVLARFPGLGPERSILIWAFAEDAAGQRSVSLPVALDIRALYQAQRPGGGGGGNGTNPLDQLIADQRALARKTFSAAQVKAPEPSGKDTGPLADEQQALLGRTRRMVER
jgi:hypothetical protein